MRGSVRSVRPHPRHQNNHPPIPLELGMELVALTVVVPAHSVDGIVRGAVVNVPEIVGETT